MTCVDGFLIWTSVCDWACAVCLLSMPSFSPWLLLFHFQGPSICLFWAVPSVWAHSLQPFTGPRPVPAFFRALLRSPRFRQAMLDHLLWDCLALLTLLVPTLCISCLHSSSLYLKLYSMLVCSEVLRRPASFVLLTERFPVPEAVPGTW